MKRILLICLTALLSNMSVISKTHTVVRGESLQSIAQMYGITVDQLLTSNPDAGQLFFTGLKMEIPESKGEPDNNSKSISSDMISQGEASSKNEVIERDNYSKAVVSKEQMSNINAGKAPKDFIIRHNGWDVLVEITFGFLPQYEGVQSDFNYTYGISAGASYWFASKQSGAFAAATIGYLTTSSGFKSKETNTDSSTSIWLLNLPIKLGYKINIIEKRLHFTPYAGLDLGATVGGSSSFRIGTINTKTKVKTGEFATGLRLGAQIGIGYALGLGGYYMLPLGDNAKGIYGKDGNFSLCLTFGF